MPDEADEPTRKRPSRTEEPSAEPEAESADWQRRVVGRSLRTAKQRSINRGLSLVNAAAALLERSNGDSFTVQDVADEANQSLRTLYQYFESKDDLLLAVFEEAMKTYAQLISDAIAGLDDPLDRLAGAIIAAAAMSDRTRAGVDVGLSRLRLKLGEVEPELVARSQEPVTALFVDLIEQAVAAGRLPECDPEQMAYVLAALNTAFVISHTLGNDYGLALPDPVGLATFCLGGLGADRSSAAGLIDRLDFPTPSASRSQPGSKRRGGRAIVAGQA